MPLDTRVFGEILEGGGVQPIRLPPKSPNLNAYAERFVRSMKGGVSQSRRPPRRRARASPRGRVRRPLPSRAKPPGTRQPAPATTATAGEPGRRRSAAGASGRIAQFLPPGGRMSGRPIKRTLRGRWLSAARPRSDSRPRSSLHSSLWRDLGERWCSADSAPTEESQSQRLCRTVRPTRVVPLGERHLRCLVREYVEHYHRERNHQGLDNQLLQRPPPPVRTDADVRRRERLGGLLNFYYREAA